jgi:hypothetical protein
MSWGFQFDALEMSRVGDFTSWRFHELEISRVGEVSGNNFTFMTGKTKFTDTTWATIPMLCSMNNISFHRLPVWYYLTLIRSLHDRTNDIVDNHICYLTTLDVTFAIFYFYSISATWSHVLITLRSFITRSLRHLRT